MIYKAFLVIHIIGITIMAGTTFIDYITLNQFWKTLSTDKIKAAAFGQMAHRLQRFTGIGMLSIILSGIGMMAYLHQVWGKQIWFQTKMGILLLIIANGLGYRRILGNKLRKIQGDGILSEANPDLSALKSKMTLVHLFQMFFFIVIFTLSVYKFT